MKEIVYLDLYFLWNFLMDGVLLLLAGWICSEKTKWLRLLAASTFGALCSTCLLLWSVGRYLTLILGLVSFLPMILIAFGRRSLRRLTFLSLFAFFASFFLGGALEAISYYALGTKSGVTLGVFLAAVFFAYGAFLLWGRRVKRKMESRVISLSILNGENEEHLYGLVDSAAFLCDPESGNPVILLKAEYAQTLLSTEEILRLRLGQGEGVVPISMKTASGAGHLFAFLPKAVRFHRPGKRKQKEEPILVALDFSGGGYAGCPCLVPLSVI